MSTETLVTCPTCNTPNFTERGLKAHRCKAMQRVTRQSVVLFLNSRKSGA